VIALVGSSHRRGGWTRAGTPAHQRVAGRQPEGGQSSKGRGGSIHGGERRRGKQEVK